jgi:hypothetical protein
MCSLYQHTLCILSTFMLDCLLPLSSGLSLIQCKTTLDRQRGSAVTTRVIRASDLS